jgi:hypothetical protein
MTLSVQNPNILDAVKSTAIGRAAVIAAQKASPGFIDVAQRIISAKSLYDLVFGVPFGDAPLASLGYLTPRQLKAMQDKINEAGPARKNLFFVRITDGNPPLSGPATKVSGLFDLMCLGVSYAPSTITGEKTPIGSGVMDRVTGSEAIDLQLTTMDDEQGTLKEWFDAKAAQVCRQDGTFGLPAQYTVGIEVVHGLASNAVSSELIKRTYRASMLMRPANIQHELSRQDVGIQELQMTFTQVDTWRTFGAGRGIR